MQMVLMWWFQLWCAGRRTSGRSRGCARSRRPNRRRSLGQPRRIPRRRQRRHLGQPRRRRLPERSDALPIPNHLRSHATRATAAVAQHHQVPRRLVHQNTYAVQDGCQLSERREPHQVRRPADQRRRPLQVRRPANRRTHRQQQLRRSSCSSCHGSPCSHHHPTFRSRSRSPSPSEQRPVHPSFELEAT